MKMNARTLEEEMKEKCKMERLITPRELKDILPIPPVAKQTVEKGREDIKSVLRKEDKRKLIILGPCSIHNPNEAYELGEKLMDFSRRVDDQMIIIYRAYFQKPRTRGGWKGHVYDPEMDESYRVNEGIQSARQLLVSLNNLGIPCATEFLDRAVQRRIGELISWGAIGARSTESQDHRDWVSGYPMPIGFKNPTSGNIDLAIDGAIAASMKTVCFDEDENGKTVYLTTTGNKYGHVVLRGGKNNGESLTNYDAKSVNDALDMIKKAGLSKNVIIDCSHGNSKKKYANQIKVLKDVQKQILSGNEDIVGIMMEVNLDEGAYDPQIKGIQKGKSRTDQCLGINRALSELNDFYNALKSRS